MRSFENYPTGNKNAHENHTEPQVWKNSVSDLHLKFSPEVTRSHDPKTLKTTGEVWMLTTYPPKECGIATFSQDLLQSINLVFEKGIKIKIAAIDKKMENRIYPSEVTHIFEAENIESYGEFVSRINDDPKILSLVVQHEFGLFPGEHHQDFNSMLHGIKKPIVIVMHTVLPSPDPLMKVKVIDMAQAATNVIVMTRNSARLLATDYHIAEEKIVVIPHGTHLPGHLQKNLLKEKYGLQGRTVLSTFGLMSRNKSIETTLKALPEIVKKYPGVIFLMLGRTHPGVIKHEGEKYREELEALVEKNNLGDHVRFVNHYLSLDELLNYLGATDIYVFTSKDPGQAVSGTFSYALSAGCALVSTPIPHAKELHDLGNGLLFEFENPSSLATQLFRYLDDPAFREELGMRAIETMAGTAWENIANIYMDLLGKIAGEKLSLQYRMRPVNMFHFENLTTNIGMVQFARFHHPDLASGYTLDDNARALIAASMEYKNTHSVKVLKLMSVYLQFIADCQIPDGSFINYRDENGVATDDNYLVNLEDSNGRAIWALGYLIGLGRELHIPLIEQAVKIMSMALPKLETIQSPRAIAFILKGLYYYNSPDSSRPDPLFEKLAGKLAVRYNDASCDGWKWYEDYLTYANGVMPEAMLIAYQVTPDAIYKKIAVESFDFSCQKSLPEKELK